MRSGWVILIDEFQFHNHIYKEKYRESSNKKASQESCYHQGYSKAGAGSYGFRRPRRSQLAKCNTQRKTSLLRLIGKICSGQIKCTGQFREVGTGMQGIITSLSGEHEKRLFTLDCLPYFYHSFSRLCLAVNLLSNNRHNWFVLRAFR